MVEPYWPDMMFKPYQTRTALKLYQSYATLKPYQQMSNDQILLAHYNALGPWAAAAGAAGYVPQTPLAQRAAALRRHAHLQLQQVGECFMERQVPVPGAQPSEGRKYAVLWHTFLNALCSTRC